MTYSCAIFKVCNWLLSIIVFLSYLIWEEASEYCLWSLLTVTYYNQGSNAKHQEGHGDRERQKETALVWSIFICLKECEWEWGFWVRVKLLRCYWDEHDIAALWCKGSCLVDVSGISNNLLSGTGTWRAFVGCTDAEDQSLNWQGVFPVTAFFTGFSSFVCFLA